LLSSGTKLGAYEITGALGAGGMGEVYRARDTRLGREVALKVLPEAFARDAERLARFRREAQVLASLNHPNIAAIYGFEESGATHALVMELVEGPTLAEKISGALNASGAANADLKVAATKNIQSEVSRAGLKAAPTEHHFGGAIAIDEALPMAKQICDALEYAHERGIVHRDLKPANIKISSNDAVKILDFGLAKALEGDAAAMDISSSPTITRMATQAGIILGTAAYMSPEQAKGKSVDRRTDIWAFGCVLYEMLTGRQAFSGETVTDTLAAVIKTEPEWGAFPANTPQAIRNLLMRCLKKDARQRLQSIGDARIAIEETTAGGQAEVAQVGGDARVAWQRSAWLLGGSLLIVGIVAGVAAGWWGGARRNPPNLEWSAQRLGGPSLAMGPRISPDGHTLAFQAMVDNLTQVAVMDTDSGDWTVLTKDRTRGYVTELNWSTDGSEIYFDRDLSVPNGIYAVSRFGGDEHLVLENAMGPEVLPDGTLLVTRVNKDRIYQLYHFWPESGRVEPLDAFFTGAVTDLCPPVRAFHEGKEAVFYGETLEQGQADSSPHLYVIDLTSGKARRVAPQVDLHVNGPMSLFPIAATTDDESILLEKNAGDLYRIISIPRHGIGPIRTLFSLTSVPSFVDVAKAGDIYVDQIDRPIEVRRFSASGANPEVLASTDAASDFNGRYQTLQLPDGRVVFDSVWKGRSRLEVATPGGEATPLIQTKEETSMPACLIEKSEIAFLLGSSNQVTVAVASLADGRIVQRFESVPGNEVNELGSSPDGKTLYYIASRTLWAIPVSGGQPRRIGAGDSFAVDPNGKDLVVQLNETEGVRLLQVPVSGGVEQPIPFQSALRLTTATMNPNAMAKDGRLVLSVAMPDSWFYGAGILDPRSGKLERIPLNFTGDLLSPGWLDDGRILSSGWPLRSTLWRFHPVANGEK
jgi:eukaryotic-like serine/threonine-protein kinase